MEDVDWSFYLLKSCYLIHKIGRTIAEEPMQSNQMEATLRGAQQYLLLLLTLTMIRYFSE